MKANKSLDKTLIKICLLRSQKYVHNDLCRFHVAILFFFLGLLHGDSILKLILRFSRNNVQSLRNSTLYSSQDLLHPSKLGSGFEHIVVALGMVETLFFLCELFHFRKQVLHAAFRFRIRKDPN
jgi:hypothetical protein